MEWVCFGAVLWIQNSADGLISVGVPAGCAGLRQRDPKRKSCLLYRKREPVGLQGTLTRQMPSRGSLKSVLTLAVLSDGLLLQEAHKPKVEI